MSGVSKDNPTGITEFDIREWAAQAEWQQIAQLVNRMVLRVAADGEPIDRPDVYRNRAQDHLADALSHLGRAVAFMDCCTECDRARRADDGDWVDSATPPYRTEIEGDWLRGTYRCAAGHEWTCGYSLRPMIY